MNKGCLRSLIVIVIIVVVGAGGVIYWLWADENAADATFKGEKPSISDVVLKSVATGSVEPRKEIEIKPQVSGIIREIYVEAGDTVTEGDLIAKVKVIPDMLTLSNAQNRLDRAQIAVDNADMDYNRNESLLEQGVIAAADFQQFEVARRNANEEYQSAQENLEIIKEGVSKSSGAATNTLVKSTISGMILDVPVEEGNSVIETNNFNEGTTISSIADMEDLIFLGNIDESEVEKLETGMELIVSVGAIEGRTFAATLEYISPKGVELNGAIQFEIKAAISMDEGEFIRAGYSANADVVLDKRDQVLTINESVVQYDGKQPFVEAYEGNGWSRKEVSLGLSDGIIVEVLDGVAEGDSLKLWNQPIMER
jgi:HlyD family secretion protein